MSPNRERIRVFRSRKWIKVRLLCYPLALAIAIRVIGAVWIFHLLSPEGKFHTPWMDANPHLILPTRWTPIPLPTLNWLWLFNAWDSLHFPLIAIRGYIHPDYVFLPAFPLLIHFLGMLIGDYWLAAFLVTQAFALASIAVFQLLAELYMQPKEALYATLLMSTFPYVSVFTTLDYSEALFLFSILSTWYFFKKGRILKSSLLAGLASVTRIYGFAIVLPIFLEIAKSKRYRKLLYLAIPVAFIGSWMFFCYLSTGDPLVSWTDETYWIFDSKFSLAQTILSQALNGVIGCCTLDPGILIAVGLFAYLVVKTWQVDRSLWAYSAILFSALLFTVVNHLSLLRYLPFIFPIWLTVKLRNPSIVTMCVLLFVPVGLLLWLYAISVAFIG